MKFPAIQIQPQVDIGDIRTFRAENFPYSDQRPWLDRPDWQDLVAEKKRRGEIDSEQAQLCTQWAEHGYIIIPQMFSNERLDAIWKEYEDAIARGVAVPQEDFGADAGSPFPGRTLNAHLKISGFDSLLRDEYATEIASMLLGVSSLPFQTIAGHKGSQQKAHSDSIHMTTYPQGYLVANWIAFEDIAPDSGPLEYYPGSHRLPYVYSRECGIGLEEARANYTPYQKKYETYIERQIVEQRLERKFFNAHKGDVLFWHANLLHGGSPIQNTNRSRLALVCHYFADGCICYHDYTGTPTYLTDIPFLQRHQFDAAEYLRHNPDVAAAGMDPYKHYTQFGYKEKRRVR